MDRFQTNSPVLEIILFIFYSLYLIVAFFSCLQWTTASTSPEIRVHLNTLPKADTMCLLQNTQTIPEVRMIPFATLIKELSSGVIPEDDQV